MTLNQRALVACLIALMAGAPTHAMSASQSPDSVSVANHAASNVPKAGKLPQGDAWSDWFEPPVNPRVIETGIEVERWVGSDNFVVEWLDDERIAFSEVIDPSLYEKHSARYMPKENLRVVFYNIHTGAKEVYKPGELYCLKNGRIIYGVLPDNSAQPGTPIVPRVLHAGALGAEIPRTVLRGEYLNRLDCDISPRLPGAESGNPIRYLKLEHGYIDIGVHGERDKRPARYVRRDGKVIELPFKGSNLQQLRWLGEYWQGYSLSVFSSHIKTKDDPVDMYFLNPSGAIRLFPRAINAEKAVGWTTNYFPSRVGAIGMAQQPIRMDMPGRSGVYLDDSKSYKRLHSGFITNNYLAASPDGCKLPFASRQTFLYGAPAYLMILDLCGDKK